MAKRHQKCIEGFCSVCGKYEYRTDGEVVLCAVCLIRKEEENNMRMKARAREIDWSATISAIRRHTGMTQRELGAHIGIPPAHFSQIKRGERAIPAENLERLKEYYAEHISYRDK